MASNSDEPGPAGTIRPDVNDLQANHILEELCETAIVLTDSEIEIPLNLVTVLERLAVAGERRRLSGRLSQKPKMPCDAGTEALQMAILQNANAKMALWQWTRQFGRALTDREVLADLGERLDHARLSNESWLTVPLRTAQELLLLVKAGVQRSRGGQPCSPRERLRLDSVISLALSEKRRLIEEANKKHRKLRATDAQAEAIEVARHCGGRELFSALYIKRRMEAVT